VKREVLPRSRLMGSISTDTDIDAAVAILADEASR
jgi:hypothetical protein